MSFMVRCLEKPLGIATPKQYEKSAQRIRIVVLSNRSGWKREERERAFLGILSRNCLEQWTLWLLRN